MEGHTHPRSLCSQGTALAFTIFTSRCPGQRETLQLLLCAGQLCLITPTL